MKFVTYALFFSILLISQAELLAQESARDTTPTYKKFVGGSIAYERNDGFINSVSSFNGLGDRVQFNIQPFVGIQVSQKTQLGLTAGFTLQESFYSGFGFRTISSSEVNLGLFVRNQLIKKGSFTFLLESTASGSYEYGRYYETTGGTTTGGLNEVPYRGPYGFTFSLSPRVSYDLKRFRFLATFGSAGISAVTDSSNTRGDFLSTGGSRIFVSALTRFLGLSVEYKF